MSTYDASKKRITKALIRLCGCAGWSAPVLFPNPRRQVFSGRGPYDKTCLCHIETTHRNRLASALVQLLCALCLGLMKNSSNFSVISHMLSFLITLFLPKFWAGFFKGVCHLWIQATPFIKFIPQLVITQIWI